MLNTVCKYLCSYICQSYTRRGQSWEEKTAVFKVLKVFSVNLMVKKSKIQCINIEDLRCRRPILDNRSTIGDESWVKVHCKNCCVVHNNFLIDKVHRFSFCKSIYKLLFINFLKYLI